jgi:hypothetical protein
MNKIYQYASRVIVWLGEAGRGIELTAPIIPLVAQASGTTTVPAIQMTPQHWAILP